MPSRRNFIQKAILGLALVLAIPFMGKSSDRFKATKGLTDGPSKGLAIGVAGYTFAKFDLEKSISMMKRIGVVQSFPERNSCSA